MVLSKRERYIVIAVGVAGLALILDKVVLGRLWDQVIETTSQKDALQKKMNDAAETMKLSQRMAPRWDEMVRTGMKSDPADAEGQVVQAVHNWASESRFTIQMIKADRPPPARDAFLGEIAFTVAGNGSMSAVANLLWRMQYALIPLRITEIQVVSTKEATDNLSATVRLSTVYLPGGRRATGPPAPAASAPAASGPAGGGR